jgi:hypothetical protein
LSDERKWAERKAGFARLFARAKQVLTTDPTGSDEDDHVVDEEAARVLAQQAGRLKGGLAKIAQLSGRDPRRFEDAAELYAALLLWNMNDGSRTFGQMAKK